MSLRAIEALARPAMVTNENFFSHAHPVFTAGGLICQVLFSRGVRRRAIEAAKAAQSARQKKSITEAKKACQRCTGFYNALKFGLHLSFLMNLTIVVKRAAFVLLTVGGLALCAIGANDKPPCPLPAEANQQAQDPAQSPEHPACMRRVFHNGMVICLPCPAADAHVRQHGDADMGPCSKPGNETPPGQS